MTRHDAPRSRVQRLAESAMALALAVMALAVFINVVLRYGFGSGIAASEELSRLLFVWMVFIGATAAYPLGEHMAFTSLLRPLQNKPIAMRVMAVVIHGFVVLACALVGWGAWQQVVVGLDSKSVVMGYSAALLPLPAFLSSVAIGVMALINLVRGKAIELGHEVDVE
ncbi:TRAP transporter small permease subunit [Piscinibacter sp. HJYY11]|uniref:TRAP transporter small permease subunit n=1 Tax=Piscinibacter sp. HJYY11 TaxID=2801333 RepID=UPI00191FFD86|nr:TRAP transporter small permease subunit [Piscinibacter sp. HJYY11]MBL0726941.1 TRAP transporter small permease subunit [Piscinibacter sp. HJYY11]